MVNNNAYKQQRSCIKEQVEVCEGILGKGKRYIILLLEKMNVTEVRDITPEIKTRYRMMVDNDDSLSTKQKQSYRNAIEQIQTNYGKHNNRKLFEDTEKAGSGRGVYKLFSFLVERGIYDASEITFSVRMEYKNYIETTTGKAHRYELINLIDRVKLNNIKEQTSKSFGKGHVNFTESVVYLPYWPEYSIAYSFYHAKDKEAYVFDFTAKASMTLKLQVYSLLRDILSNNSNNVPDRNRRLLRPLVVFYRFCCEKEIEDIALITAQDVNEYRQYISDGSDSHKRLYFEILGYIRRFVFLTDKSIRWESNVWFLERMKFKDERINPARDIVSMSFDDIENANNCTRFKQFMKYESAVASKISMTSVRNVHYGIHKYLKYCDKSGIDATKAGKREISDYLNFSAAEDVKEETYNGWVLSLSKFYKYLWCKGMIKVIPIEFSYYYKETYKEHHDRSVQWTTVNDILNLLKTIPYHERLLFLNICCTGCRKSEACVLKGNAYRLDSTGVAWARMYQCKLRAEKEVPIPRILYDLMVEYISENEVGTDEWIFKNRKGGAYQADTFSKHMKKYILDAGIDEYSFKAHDFRHLIATMLDNDGVPIEVIRDFLGHRDSDMTREYIDYMQKQLEIKNKSFFAENESLAKLALEKVNEKNKDKRP